jgi:hypothetical protein
LLSFPDFNEAIISIAAQQGCDLTVMASHGRSGVRTLLIGSETQKVLTHVPVLVVRPPAPPRSSRGAESDTSSGASQQSSTQPIITVGIAIDELVTCIPYLLIQVRSRSIRALRREGRLAWANARRLVPDQAYAPLWTYPDAGRPWCNAENLDVIFPQPTDDVSCGSSGNDVFMISSPDRSCYPQGNAMAAVAMPYTTL